MQEAPTPDPEPSVARGGGLIHLAGPPDARRSLLLRQLADDPPGRSTWWIVATPAAAAAVRRRLGTRAARLSPGVMTLRQAAAGLVQASPAAQLPLGPAARQALAAELADAAGHRSALGPLEPLIRSPGLVDFLTSRFRQLRRQGVGPAQAGSALRKSDGEEAGGVLARLYRDYLDALETGRLLDDEEAILQATVLATPENTPQRLIIDLPLSVTAIEEDLIEALAKHAQVVTLALGGPSGASDDWLPAAPRRLGAWQKRLAKHGAAESIAAPTDDSAPGLAKLRRDLFNDAAAPSADPTGVAVVAGGSVHDTARRVARRVKRLLTSGATPSEVVLAAPSLDATAPRYAEALREYGVPVAVDAAPRLGTAGVVGAALDLLTLASTDWAFEPLLTVLSRGDLPAFSSKSADGRSLRASAEWLVRDLQIASGRAYLLRQTEQLATREADGGRVSRLNRAAKASQDAFERLGAACDLLPSEASPLEWLDAVDAALRWLGHAGLNQAALPADRQACDTLEEAAASLEALARWRGREPRRLTLRDWTGLVRSWATRLRLPSEGSAEGRVRLVGLTTAIGLPCQHLLVVDAGESAFSAGLAAGDEEAADEAMLLFYELASTPAQSLTYAYAALDDSAQPLSASPLIADVERLFEKDALRRGERALLGPIDLMSEPASTREWRLRSVAQAAEGDPASLASYTTRHGAAIVDALRSIDRRARGDHFGAWEGVLTDQATHQVLAERFGPDHLWSASQLELMATCPYKFFARQVLRMEPVGELALGVDYRRRGLLMHDALAECLMELARELPEGQSLRSVPPDELTERLVAHIDAQLNAGKLPPHEAALARIEARQASEWAARYAGQQAKYDNHKLWSALDLSLRPTLLEARFGPAKGDDGAEDAASTDEPLELRLPGGETLRVTGRIDRIDTGQAGGRTLFTVIDYKTSKSYTVEVESIEAGRQLQPVLYALAAQELLLEDDALPAGAGYWVVQKNGFVAPSEKKLPLVKQEDGVAQPSPEWLATVERAKARCEQLVTSVREGEFPMYNIDENCGRSCEFRTVCRVGQTRSLGKTPAAAAEESP